MTLVYTPNNFWNLPLGDWRNLTNYDFRFVIAHQEVSKRNAHLAYSKDIKELRKVVKDNSNGSRALDACEDSLNKASSNHTNIYFWQKEAKKLVEITTKRMINKEEMSNLKQETIMSALRLHNSRNLEDNNSISNNSNNINNNNGDSSNSSNSDVNRLFRLSQVFGSATKN
ncbi:hypothetical protein BDC45DRAFT_611370 [Circinella umbellata]|nr:hypothetical protein BDC45DRAFT_611370 [Circinella umbellata]